MIQVVLIGLFALLVVGLLVSWLVTHAASGYQDTTGFYYGECVVTNAPILRPRKRRRSSKVK